MNHYDRDKETRKTVLGYDLSNNSIYVLSHLYCHKTILYCSKNCSLTWSNKNDSRVYYTYNSTNDILCIGLGPWSVILTESSILFYSIKFLLPAWTWKSCILKSSFGNGLSYEYLKIFKTHQIFPHYFSYPSHFSGKCARYLVRWQIQALFEVRKSQETQRIVV